MKRIFAKFMVALCILAMMLVMAAAAFAAVKEGPGRGNPDTNPTGKCPPGQNQDTSPGGLKKCS